MSLFHHNSIIANKCHTHANDPRQLHEKAEYSKTHEKWPGKSTEAKTRYATPSFDLPVMYINKVSSVEFLKT